MRGIADAMTAGRVPPAVGELPDDPELLPVTDAVRSVLSVITRGDPRSRGAKQRVQQ
jgi:hypothetical protein